MIFEGKDQQGTSAKSMEIDLLHLQKLNGAGPTDQIVNQQNDGWVMLSGMAMEGHFEKLAKQFHFVHLIQQQSSSDLADFLWMTYFTNGLKFEFHFALACTTGWTSMSCKTLLSVPAYF